MKNKIGFIIFLFALLVISSASAINDYTLELGDFHTSTESITRSQFKPHSTKYSLCMSDTKIIPVWITAGSANNFRFALKGVSWATLSGGSLNLKANQSGVVFIILKPKAEGTNNLFLYITSQGTYAGYVPIKLVVDDCYSIKAAISPAKDEICGCENSKYDVILENNGKFKEKINLLLEGADFANLSSKYAQVGSNNKSTVILTASPGCKTAGKYDIKLIASLESNPSIESQSSLSLDVTPKESCYKASINAPKNIRADYYGKTVPIKIKNTGVTTATYSVELVGPEWIAPDKKSLTINNGQELNLNLNIKPPQDLAPGIYPLEIKLKTKDLEYSGKTNIVLKKENAIYKAIGYVFTYYLYDIIAGIVILVILIFLIIFFRKTKFLRKARIKAKTKRKLRESVKPSLAIIGILACIGIAVFLIVRYVSEPLKYNSLMYDFITNFLQFKNYIYYSLIAVGAVLLVVILTYLIRKFGNNKRKGRRIEETKYEVKGKKIFHYSYIIWAILLAGAVFSFIYFKLYSKMAIVFGYFSGYLYYVIAGIVILTILILVFNLIRRSKKQRKKGKKIKIKPILLILGIIIIAGAAIYSIIYYGLVSVITEFLVLYYPYIIGGFVILLILILVLKLFKKD